MGAKGLWRSAVLAATMLVGTLAPGAAHAAPGSGPTAAVALGDSYISGEAGRWNGNSNQQLGSRDGTDRAFTGFGYDRNRVYLEGTGADGGCHRSDVAEIRSAALGYAEAINLSCSGATAANVWRTASGGQPKNGEAPQADRLAAVAAAKNVKLVVLSVGGNDLGFADIIAACATAWTTSPSWWPRYCSSEQQAVVNSRMPTTLANVRKAVEEIRFVMEKGAGYTLAGPNPPTSSQYRLVVQSYPSPVPRGAENRYSQSGWTRLSVGGCPFWNRDLDWARDSLVDQLADGIGRVATGAGARYLDLRDLLQGREACARDSSLVTASNPPASTRSEWARFLVSGAAQGDLQESFHPNAYGQRALGRCLFAVADARPLKEPSAHACRNTTGAGPEAVGVATTSVSGARAAKVGRPRAIERPWPPALPSRNARPVSKQR